MSYVQALQVAVSSAYIALTERTISWKVSNRLQSSMVECQEIEKKWPDAAGGPAGAPNIVGFVIETKEFEVLDKTIAAWTRGDQQGEEAWEKIKEEVLRSRGPKMVGFDSMVNLDDGQGDRCPTIFGAGIVSVEAHALFDFMQDLFVASSTIGGELIRADIWIKAMRGLGVNEPMPQIQTIKALFKERVVEAMTIGCPSFGWIKLVKACVCLEVVRRVEAPVGAFPMVAPPPQESVGTLLSSSSPLLEKRDRV